MARSTAARSSLEAVSGVSAARRSNASSMMVRSSFMAGGIIRDFLRVGKIVKLFLLRYNSLHGK